MNQDAIEGIRASYEHAVKRAGEAWRAIPGMGAGRFGLTPDHVKQSPEYRAARAAYEKAHRDLRAFNARHKPQRRAPMYSRGNI